MANFEIGTKMYTSNEYGTVTVPVEDLNAVYKLIVKRAKMRERLWTEMPAAGDEETSIEKLTRSKEQAFDRDERIKRKIEIWDTERLEKLAASSITTAQQVSGVMDILALDPGQVKKYDREDIATMCDMPKGTLSAMFTRIGRHFEKNYGTHWWPFMADDGSEFDPERKGTWYWLPDEIAAKWKAIRLSDR